jgi:hypothetical protein
MKTLTTTLLLGLTALASAQQNLPKHEAMDYGRFLSASIDNAQGKNPFEQKGGAANKAVVVNLGDRAGGYAFDTETLRAAGGWTGGWLRFKGVTFDGGHGPNPGPAQNAKIHFETNPGPGWSPDGSFKDPRPLPKGPEGVMSKIPLGPLPRDHSKYLGLFLHGDRVTFHYSVGGAELLESAELETIGGVPVVSRSFTVTKGELNASVRLQDLPYGGSVRLAEAGAVVTMKFPVPPPPPAPKGKKKAAPAPAPKAPDDEVTAVVGRGLPAGSAFSQDGGFLSLKVKASAGTSFKVSFAHGAVGKDDALLKAAAGTAGAADLTAFTKGGPARWTQTVVTDVTPGEEDQAKQAESLRQQLAGESDPAAKQVLEDRLKETLNAPYLVDNLNVPLDNPYRSWIRVGAIDFFKDGRIAFSTWSGDVWIGGFSDDKPSKITWKRHATGLFHALGLRIVDDVLYVLGRDQITRLHDLNGDGEADRYENFNNDVQVTSNFHEFTFDLQTDAQGNFYFLKGGPVNPGGRGWGPLSDHHGAIFKVSPDGKKFEVHATGIRAPNGMGVGPNGEVSNGDNQGTWVPADYIHFSKPGEFIEVPDLAHREQAPAKYSPHLCWIPYDVDNSNGGQTWVTSKKWGPFEGRMLYLSYGKSSLFGVLQERVGDVPQGGVVKFPLKFSTGIMRGRFHPVDGQLYVAGLKGWQTNGVKDGAIHRVRYTGKSVTMQDRLHVTKDGITLGFTGALDRKSATDLQNWSVEQYNYKYSSEYGSADYKVSKPGEQGTDPVAVKSVKLSDDGKEVFLEIPGLQPVMQMRIKMALKAVDGTRVPEEVSSTINVVPDAKGSDYRSFAK